MGFLDYAGLAKVWLKIKSNFISKSSVSAKSTTLTWNTETEIANIDGKSIKIKIPSNPNTNTTYTFAEGTTNGAFSVTPSGGTAQSVPVHGVVTKVKVGTTEYNPSSGLVSLPAYPTKSSWNYDDTYLKLSGGTLTGTLTTSGSRYGSQLEVWRKSDGLVSSIGFYNGATTKTLIGQIGISGDTATSMAPSTPFWQIGSSTFYQLAYSTAKTQIGNATTPVYVNNAGQIVAGTGLGTASTHAHGDYVTSITYDSTNRILKQSKGGAAATNIVTFGTGAFATAADYVTIAGSQTITGQKNFNTATNTVPVIISRLGHTSEALSIGVDDAKVIFKHQQDELVSDFLFTGSWADVESGHDGASAGEKSIRFGLSSTDHNIYVGSSKVLHSSNYTSYVNTTNFPGLNKTGTVTSVAMTVPTGLSISGSPITESGTLALTFASGYSIPTTAKQGNWDTAYNNWTSTTRAKNLVFAGPSAGSNAVPTFRALVAADIPNLDWSKINSGKPTTLSGYGITDALPWIDLQDNGSTTAGTWIAKSDPAGLITSYTDGLTVRYKITVAGASNTYLNVNGLGNKQIYRYNNARLTTHYPVGSWIYLVYSSTLNNGSWVMVGGGYDTTYSAGTKELFDAGSNTSNRVWSASVLASAVAPKVHTHTFASLDNKPTTLGGYGITDANISGNTITLGSNTITPLVSHQTLTNHAKLADTSTAGQILVSKSGGYEWKTIGAAGYKSVDTDTMTASSTNLPTSKAVAAYVSSAMTSVLTYKGTIGSSGATVSSLPASHKQGDVYVVKTAGTYAGQACEVGDYIICNTAGSSASNAHWDVVNGENQVVNEGATLSWGTAVKIATVDGTDIKVSLPANPNTNTTNTAGTTQKASTKLFLVGGESQSTYVTTYSNDKVYIGTDNCLYSNGSKVLTSLAHTITIKSGKKSDGTTDISATSSSAASPSVTLGESGVTAGAYGDSADQTPAYGATFSVPYVRVNAQGIVTEISSHTVKIPVSDNSNTARLQVSDTSNRKINTKESANNYLQFNGGDNKFTITDGTNNFEVPITITSSSHNHDGTYLKLTGGTLSGSLTTPKIRINGLHSSSNKNNGIYYYDGTNDYLLIGQGSENLWIGANETAGTHHTGSTYISAGSGDVYVSRLVSGTRKNYKVLDAGNTSLSGSTVTINGTAATFSLSNHNHDSVYLKLSGGGTVTGEINVKNSGEDSSRLRFVNTSAGTYIESGNSDFSDNKPLHITGRQGQTGSDLYLSFTNVYYGTNKVLHTGSTLDATKLSGTIPAACYTNSRDAGFGKITPGAASTAVTAPTSNTTQVLAATYNENITFTPSNKWIGIGGSNSTSGSDVVYFGHALSGITAGTAGTSSATSGSTLAVPYVTLDAAGHVTAYGTHTHTITGFAASSHDHERIKPTRYDTDDPAPNTKGAYLTFQFSNINSKWWNVLNMRSYTDNNYVSAELLTPANNPGSDTGYSGDMMWRQGRNSTWLGMRTILDSENYTTYVNTTNFPGLDKTGTITQVGNTTSGAVTVSSSNNTAAFGSAVTVGSVGGVDLKFTMPANPNTDNKVTQTPTTSSNTSWRPLILGGGNNYSDATVFAPVNVTDGVLSSHLAKFAPARGIMALVGLNKLGTDGKIVTGSDTTVWNTNGGTTTINNASLGLQVNGTAKTTFYANDSSNKTFNIANGTSTSGNGTFLAGGVAVSIYGLKSAAYTESSSYVSMNGTTSSAAIDGSLWIKEHDGIRLHSSNKDVRIWSVEGNSSTYDDTFGYYLLYEGTGSGIDNSLKLYTTGPNSGAPTNTLIYTINLNGITTYNKALNAPTPDTTDNSTRVATTAWVNGKGYITSSSLTSHAKITDTTTVGQALVSKSGGYEWKTLGGAAYKAVDETSMTSSSTNLPTSKAVAAYVSSAMTSVLSYKGTIGTGGTVTSLPASHKVGDVYVVSTAGTYAGKACEVGDYIICKTAGTSASDAHWDVVNGENQVENKSASLASAGNSATIATVDGTNITVTTPSSWTGLAKTGTVTKVSTSVGLVGGDITTTGTLKVKLKDETANGSDSSKSDSTNGGLYAVEVDKSGYLAVRVPWTDHTYTVNNGTLNLQANGTTKTTFTANQSGNSTFNIATGSTDGSISVAGVDVAVKGLGDRAFDSTSYLPLSGGTLSSDDAVISREGKSVSWVNGRKYPIIKTTSYTGYNSILSMKTTNGSWDLGVHTDTAYLTYITDSDYSSGNNSTTYHLSFPKDSGTVALTKNIPSVSNATITIKQTGKNNQTFTLNGSAATITLEDTTYLAGTKALFDAGTDTTERVWTAAVLKSAVAPISHSHAYVPVSTTSSIGLDVNSSYIGYIGGLTAAAWNYGKTDGAMYTQYYSTSWKHQIYADYRTGHISVRGKNNGTWQSWHSVFDMGNVTAGDNVGITQNSSTGQITISATNTWRGIQDNLTSSTNTTDSLSAKQGYLLANGSARDNTKLPLSGGTMTGPLKWNDESALPKNTSPQYFVSIDAFADGGTTKWASKSDTLKSLTGLTSTAVGDSDEPIYWTGSAFSKCGPFASSGHNHDGVYVKLEAGTSEQTIKNTTANISNGTIEIWRGISGGYPMIGFATGTTKTKLGFLGFGVTANQPILRTTGGVDYNLIHAGNYTTYCAKSNHTHTTTIASSSGTNQLTLANGGKYSLTAGGTSYIFTMPAGTGSTNSDSKLYLVGATTQAASTVTYSDSEVYTTNGTLTTKSVQVGGGSATIQYNSTNQCIEFVFN